MSETSDSSSESEIDFSEKTYQKEKDLLQTYYDSEVEDFEEDTIDPDAELNNIPDVLPGTPRIESLGYVYAIMKPFVVISPNSKSAVLDIGSLVTLSGSAEILGIVWDVFGPVVSPLYSVLVKTKHFSTLSVNDEVGFSLDHISIVSREALFVEKGIDNDPNCAEDFSDDEQERSHLKGLEAGEV